jgi:hypothetical protein
VDFLFFDVVVVMEQFCLFFYRSDVDVDIRLVSFRALSAAQSIDRYIPGWIEWAFITSKAIVAAAMACSDDDSCICAVLCRLSSFRDVYHGLIDA